MSTADASSQRIKRVKPSLIRALHDRRRPSSLNLGLGQPSLPVEKEILDEGLRRMLAGDMGYTANAGLPSLREAIARHHALPKCQEADNVVVTCGSQEAIVATMAALLDANDEVLLPDPIFPGYEMATTMVGATCRSVPRRADNGFRLVAEDVAAAISPRTKLVVVNSPCNPTGAVDEERDVRLLADLARKHDFAILSDEIYSDLNYTDRHSISPAQFGENTIVISGLSKNCAMTGFRLGYALAHKRYLSGILRAHSIATTCAPTLSQHMAQFVFENPTWTKRSRPVYASRRKLALQSLASALPQVPIIEPQGAFYIFADVSEYTTDSLSFALKVLQDTDVITSPGAAFGEAANTWIRLSYAGEPETFAEGVRRIGEFLKGNGLSRLDI